MDLEQFNAAGRGEAAEFLLPCLDIERWIDELIDARPYPSREALLEAARSAADPFTPAETATALARHPRIGEQAQGTGVEARFSRSEQAGLGETDAAVAAALAEGNRAYEDKFGHVFLIRAAGRSPEQILAALRTRLTHTPAEEEAVTGQQLREIAVLRLEGLMGR